MTGVLVDVARARRRSGKRVEEELDAARGEGEGDRRARLLGALARPAREDPLRRAEAARSLKRTPKGGRSTDADGARGARREAPAARASSSSYRELDKLKGTYIDALPRVREPDDGAHPHALRPGRRGDRAPLVDATRTSRTSRSAPSSGARSARAFVAPPGHVDRQRGLLADRAPRPRAPVARPAAHRRLPRRARTCTCARRRSSSTCRRPR